MTEPMSKERLKDLKEWGEARGPLLIIRELTDEIDRLREEKAELQKTIKDWVDQGKREKELREENKRLRGIALEQNLKLRALELTTEQIDATADEVMGMAASEFNRLMEAGGLARIKTPFGDVLVMKHKLLDEEK